MPSGGHSSEESRLAAAEEIVSHRFSDRTLLLRALTHPSAFEGASGSRDYERLEFLGDAVLGLVVVEELYSRFPDLGEGEMTKLKISVVSGGALADTADALGLGDVMRMGKSEQGTGSRGRRSALENVYEALVGAIYLDAGLSAARTFVVSTLGNRIDPENLGTAAPDHPKSALQEIVQAQGAVPTYRIVAEDGPPHDRRFTAEVTIGGSVAGKGVGATKKEAEMQAAAEALERLTSS